MLTAFQSPIHCLPINHDATQYQVGKDRVLTKVIYIKEEGDGSITREKSDSDDLGMYVKSCVQINRAGQVGQSVYCYTMFAMLCYYLYMCLEFKGVVYLIFNSYMTFLT